MEIFKDKCLGLHISGAKFAVYSGTDEDDVNNESDTSSTFSLQECMKEFRARRIRRLRSSQHQQAVDKVLINDNCIEGMTETDFIIQNLCNKQQERKWKPCKNGFCYCFTSDSGEGGNLENYHIKKMLTRKSRRNSRPKTFRISNFGERIANDHECYVNHQEAVSDLKTNPKSTLRAITSLETSIKDDPFIHIIQELRDNCVISRVKVNKSKIKKFENGIIVNKNSPETSRRKPQFLGIYSPTAPDIEQISNLETDHTMLQGNIQSHSSQFRRCKLGKLLQKRLKKCRYKFRYSEKSSEKSPTCNQFPEGKICSSSESVSSSVRRRERIVDNVVTKKYIKVNAERKSQLLTSKQAHPPINNIEVKNENVKPAISNETKVVSIGWNKHKIKDVINYDVPTEPIEFAYISNLPQENSNVDMVKNEKTIGWQIPPNVSLDTVDGNVHHNLASNLEDKKTAVEKKLISCQNSKAVSQSNKFLWSKQLKHLSPGSKDFIISSKKKFICLVSPKKNNKDGHCSQIKKNLFRNIAVQTSSIDSQINMHSLYQHTSTPQSLHGSYDSPLQSPICQNSLSIQSENITLNGNKAEFSFATNVLPKKISSPSNRKLSFCLYCTYPREEESLKNINTSHSLGCCHKKTYRSFNSELDQDVSVSKISYVLTKLRAKLENNDREIAGTFLEAVTDHNTTALDYVENYNEKRIDDHAAFEKSPQLSKTNENYSYEPTYSEIEDNSIMLSGTPELDNHTQIRHFFVGDNSDAFYTEVNKSSKFYKDNVQMKPQNPQVSLSKTTKDPLKSKKVITNFIPLPALPEPAESECTSYYLTLPSTLSFSQSESLNNVILMEQNSTDKSHQDLNKSDLSLHRSEIFLEKLCKSELFVGPGFKRNIFEKSENHQITDQNCGTCSSKNSIIPLSSDNTYASLTGSDLKRACNDSLSYKMPNDEVDLNNATTASCNINLSTVVPTFCNNQNKNKRQCFATEEQSSANLDEEIGKINEHLRNSCPNTPFKNCIKLNFDQKKSTTNEVSEPLTKLNSKILNAMEGCYSFKNALQKSFRKSKTFIKEKGKHLSNSLNFSLNNATASSGKESIADSTSDLEDLLFFNESASISDQIAQTVNICRKLPDMDISMEMVEAERLLLFSTLCRKTEPALSSTIKINSSMCQEAKMRFYIDDMFLPFTFNANQDIFFNNFYIITFECGGIIKSTQSSECVDGTAVFLDNGIEFVYYSELETDIMKRNEQNAIQCNVFLLRLRKISNIETESKKKSIIESLTETTTLKSSSSSSTSSSAFNEVVSRFRLHASFTLEAKDFLPYEYVHQESVNSDRICIRASCFCNLPLKTLTKSTSLLGQIRLKGRSEIRIPKHSFDGFLNVQDPCKQHNWNRRWCTLDGIFLHIWQDKSSLSISPVISIDLRNSIQKINVPLSCSPSELCARPRSFCLEYKLNKISEDTCTSPVFFSADTQNDIDDWLRNLNLVLNFIVTWL